MGRKQTKTRVLENKKVKGGYFKLRLNSPLIARSAVPGQFVMLKLGTGGALDPFLRRPLSLHKAAGSAIEILYEVVGKGTEYLSRQKPGQLIDILGPLGKGFDYPPRADQTRSPVILAGGIGAAPLVFLARRLALTFSDPESPKITVLIGARTKEQVLCEKEFKNIGCNVKIATDDGSGGFPGRVTSLLEKTLPTRNSQLSTIYACGPHPMLKEVARICRARRIPGQVSLEAHMACGIGACLGCAIKTQGGYKRVCQDGPVFKTENLVY